MPRKQKFRPRITRVKLNPEQAVLQCICWTQARQAGGSDTGVNRFACNAWIAKAGQNTSVWTGDSAAS